MEYNLEHIDYEITKACNLNCIHCSAEAGKGRAPDTDFIKKTLAKAHKLGLKRIGITGGEPFLFPKELSDLIDFSYDELNCPVHMHTNGYLLEENIGIITKRLRKIENITLSLLGYDRTHNTNSGLDGAYEKLTSATQQLSQHPIPLTIFLIPMSNNYLELSEAVKDLYELGARKFRVMTLSPGGRAKTTYETLKLNTRQSGEFVSELKSLQDNLGIEFKAGYCTRLVYPSLKSLKHHNSCMSGVNRLHINAKGYVFPCTASSGFIEMNVGNLHEQSLEYIWANSEKLRKFRDLSRESCRVQQHYKKRYLERV